MTITETTRRCSACSKPFDGTAITCPDCGRKHAPPVATWPEGAKRFLYLLVIANALQLKLDSPEQLQLEWLMENVIRGRYYEGRLVPYAATAVECYPQFLELLARWQAAGAPTEFAAIAALCGVRHPR